MGVPIDRTMTLLLGGTSLTAGRLCTPPIPWTYYLLEDMLAAPECQGPVVIINTGKGSQTSNFGATQAALWAPRRPTHVLTEDFAINDCAFGVTINQATANFYSMVNSYRTANPDVIVVHQTMSSASAGDVNRTNLGAYYTNGLVNAAALGLESLDNYYGTALVPGGWPKPMPVNLTVPVSAPSGFTYLGGTWNPAAKNANVTLSSGNLVASMAAANVGVRGTVAFTGKQVFDVTVGTDGVVGIENSSASLADGAYVGFDANGFGYASDGYLYNSAAQVAGPYAAFGAGSVVNIAYDNSTQKLWFGKDGVWQNGDPVTGTGGYSTGGGTFYAAVSASTGRTMTGSFTATGDGLHPLWPNAFQTYSYPNILAWAKRAMAAFW